MELLNRENSILQFNYDGGTHPGESRIVYVSGYVGRNNAIRGYDIDKEELRTFSLDKIRNAQEIVFDKLPCSVLPTSTLIRNIIKQYQSDGKVAFYESETDSIVSFVKPKPSPYKYRVVGSFGIEGRFGRTSITATRGNDILSVYNTNGGLVRKTKNPTAEDIIDAIKSI